MRWESAVWEKKGRNRTKSGVLVPVVVLDRGEDVEVGVDCNGVQRTRSGDLLHQRYQLAWIEELQEEECERKEIEKGKRGVLSIFLEEPFSLRLVFFSVLTMSWQCGILSASLRHFLWTLISQTARSEGKRNGEQKGEERARARLPSRRATRVKEHNNIPMCYSS